jgi:hypothetical protein
VATAQERTQKPAPREIASSPAPRAQALAGESFAKLPLQFEANTGQTDSSVKFFARGKGYDLFLNETEAVFNLNGAKRNARGARRAGKPPTTDYRPLTFDVLRLQFEGANLSPRVEGVDQLPGKVNYFVGNDPAKWRADVPTFARVRYREVYPGIDLIFYGNGQDLEYDLIVSPGADPRAIKLTLEGAGTPRLDRRGDLVLGQGGTELRFRRPFVYQETEGRRHEIAGRYVVQSPKSKVQSRGLKARGVDRRDFHVGFEIGDYDLSKPLVIDPAVVVYSTYLGGSVNESFPGVAVDAAGNVYLAGDTNSPDYPTVNPIQPPRGSQFVVVSKFNATGSALVYSTYLGGANNAQSAATANNGLGAGIAVDSGGHVYLTGFTNSNNFPTTANAFQSAFAGNQDVFLAKINPAGSALLYSTYLGGSGSETARRVAVDNNDGAWLAGATDSLNFPTKNAAQTQNAGGADVFAAKFDTTQSGAASLVWSTYLGGGADDSQFSFLSNAAIAVDPSGNAYVAGSTRSVNFPVRNAFQSANSNSFAFDCFVTKFDAAGALAYSTYLGGSGNDHCFDIADDRAGQAHDTGLTNSANFPLKNPLYSTSIIPQGGEDGFITKLSADGSQLVFSTYLMGSGVGGSSRGQAIALGPVESVYVTGRTMATNLRLKDPVQAAAGGDFDAFVTGLNNTGTALVFSTYLGGNQQDHGTGIAVGTGGSVFVAGRVQSQNYPTRNAFQLLHRGGQWDHFLTKVGFPTSALSLTEIVSNRGGDTGQVTVRIQGTGLSEGATVRLVRAGQPDIPGSAGAVTDLGFFLTATFDLRGRARGVYDVVVTNPDGASATLPGSFTIEAGRAPNVYVDVLGRDFIRVSREQPFIILYGNRGNTDAIGVAVYIRFPKFLKWQLGFTLATPPRLLANQQTIDFNQAPIHVENDQDVVIPLFVPYILAGRTGTLPIRITAPQEFLGESFEIRASISEPFFIPSPASSGEPGIVGQPSFNASLIGATKPGPGISPLNLNKPAADCILGLIDATLNGIGVRAPAAAQAAAALFGGVLGGGQNAVAAASGPPAPINMQSVANNVALTALAQAANTLEAPALATIAAVGSGALAAQALAGALPACDMAFGDDVRKLIRRVFGFDPNAKIGASGAGASRFITGDEALRYAIFFENLETATAPAQDVVITDQLDAARLDLSTFSFGPIAFADRRIVPPAGLSRFDADVDLRPAKSLFVRINARLDETTGLVTWRFSSIDPATGQPTADPLAGFLNPNRNPPEGDAHVLFTVSPKPGLATGAEIRNQARIVFDVNAPIDTPEWLNTIDNSKPVSQVAALAATQPAHSFEVSWSGTDTGSGIRGFNIFVSENGGPFNEWLTNTSATSAIFYGGADQAYSFHSVAVDRVGNQEPAKSAGEATTRTPAGNPIDTSQTFVQQHYLDFLNREPDASGLQFWTQGIESCGSSAGCREVKRIDTSAAFFLSIEFQETGYLVYRIYKAAFGDISQAAPVPVRRADFVADTQSIGQGVQVGVGNWQQQLEANKNSFANAFVSRSRFTDAYPAGLTAEQFVDALFLRAGVAPTPSERQAAITAFGAGGVAGRAAALRAVAESQTLRDAEFNRAFVLMQYFGYLRRDPDAAPDTNFGGHNFWLTKLNQFNGDFRAAEMVKAFITSIEYRGRFAP